MSVLSDRSIRHLAKSRQMITPFADGERRPRTLSYGLSSAGYDARLRSDELLLLDAPLGHRVDPKDVATIKEHAKPLPLNSDEHGAAFFVIPPHGFALGCTVEHFRIPDDVVGQCVGKSTYARCGLIVNVTPLEPGWEGYLTLELHNTTQHAIKVYPDEGICQIVFSQMDARPEVTYADKKGKYQNQVGVTLPIVN